MSHLHSNIYTPRVLIPALHRTNQRPILRGVDIEPTIHLWIHIGEDRMTPETPRKCPQSPPSPHPPPAPIINKHTPEATWEVTRFAWTALQSDPTQPLGRSETLAEQILLPHFCTVGKYLSVCSLPVCVFALCLCCGVCALEGVEPARLARPENRGGTRADRETGRRARRQTGRIQWDSASLVRSRWATCKSQGATLRRSL